MRKQFLYLAISHFQGEKAGEGKISGTPSSSRLPPMSITAYSTFKLMHDDPGITVD